MGDCIWLTGFLGDYSGLSRFLGDFSWLSLLAEGLADSDAASELLFIFHWPIEKVADVVRVPGGDSIAFLHPKNGSKVNLLQAQV